MDIDINKAMKDCEGIEKVQERTNAGVVSKLIQWYSIILFINIEAKIWFCYLWKK